MQSYASPGRVITIANSGPGAVDVRRDQPYRLRNLIGVTQHGAVVDADLNLCVEGMYDQVVDLAEGMTEVEAGSPVLMADDGTWRLVAGVTDTTGFLPFGIVTERMTRRRIVQVKLMPATSVAASGGGGGGEQPAPTSSRPTLALSNFRMGPAYYDNPGFNYLDSSYGTDGQGLRPHLPFAIEPGYTWPAARRPDEPVSKDYVKVDASGIYRTSVALRFGSSAVSVTPGVGISIYMSTFDADGVYQRQTFLTLSRGPTAVSEAAREFVIQRIPGDMTHYNEQHFRCSNDVYLGAGWTFTLFVCGHRGPDGTAVSFPGTGPDQDPTTNPYAAIGASSHLIVEKIL